MTDAGDDRAASAEPDPCPAGGDVRRVPAHGARPRRRRAEPRRRRQRHPGEDRRGARGPRPRPPRARALRRLARRRGRSSTSASRTRATTTWPRPTSPRSSRSGSRCRSALALAGLFVAIVLGIPLGILAGMRPGGVVDRVERHRDQLRARDPQLRARLLPHPGVRALARLVAGARATRSSPTTRARGSESIILPAFALGVDRGGFGRTPDPRRADRRAAVELRAHRVRGGHGYSPHGGEVRVQERVDPDRHRPRACNSPR